MCRSEDVQIGGKKEGQIDGDRWMDLDEWDYVWFGIQIEKWMVDQ